MIPLFKMPLGGAGTAEVESFASYLYRISFTHGLTVGQMLRHLYHNAGDKVAEEMELPKRTYTILPSFWARPSRSTRVYVRMAEVMTGQALKQSTLWFMGKPVGRSRNEIVAGFRWCPECLSEMLSVGEVPYFKLVWHLREISHCPHHRTPFVSECPSCGDNQSSYRRKRPLHQCQMCGGELARRKNPLDHSEMAMSWGQTGADILKLLSDLAENPECCMPDDGIILSLNDVFYYYMLTGRKQEFAAIFDIEQVVKIIEYRRLVSLKLARRIAYRLGISLYTLLNGDAINSTELLSSTWVCSLPPGFASVESKVRRNHEAVLSELKAILISENPCPSKKQLAARLGVSVGYLEYRFPALTREIVKKHGELIEMGRRQRKIRAKEAALSYFISPKYAELPKSRKQAYKVLRQETGLPNFMLKEAIGVAHEIYASV